jgi:hypothetical protein
MCFTNVNEAGKRYRYFMYSTIKKKKKKKKLDWIFVAWPNTVIETKSLQVDMSLYEYSDTLS